MKTKKIMCFLLTALSFGNNITAQTSIKKMVKEKSVQGVIYVLEQYGDDKDVLKNKNGIYEQLMKVRGKDCESFAIQDEDALVQAEKKIVKSIFSDARIKQLSTDYTNNFAVICIFNQAGEVKAVNFLRVKTSVITLLEIKALEDGFLKMKVGIYNECPEAKYFKFNFLIRFNKFL